MPVMPSAAVAIEGTMPPGRCSRRAGRYFPALIVMCKRPPVVAGDGHIARQGGIGFKLACTDAAVGNAPCVFVTPWGLCAVVESTTSWLTLMPVRLFTKEMVNGPPAAPVTKRCRAIRDAVQTG